MERKGLLLLLAVIWMPGCDNENVRIDEAEVESAKPSGPESKYLSPIAMTKSHDAKTLYIANQTSGTISVIKVDDFGKTKPGEVVAYETIQLARELTGLTLTPDGKTLYATAKSHEGEVYEIDVASGTLRATLIAGHTPMSPRVTPDGSKLVVCNRFSNTVSIFDTATGKKLKDIATPPKEPYSCAITSDGKKIVVANMLNGVAVEDKTSATVSIIYLKDLEIHKTFSLCDGTTNIRQIAISPDNKWAYLTSTRGRYLVPATNIERGWMNNNNLNIVRLDDGRESHYTSILLDDVDMGAAVPWAVRMSSDGRQIVVTHAGSHEISIMDRIELHKMLAKLEKGEDAGSLAKDRLKRAPNLNDPPNWLSLLVGIRRRIGINGKGPRALEVIGDKIYVPEYFSDTISVLDLVEYDKYLRRPRKGLLTSEWKTEKTYIKSFLLGTKQEMDEIRRGHLFFNDASLCFQKWQCCGTCHPDARQDGLYWDRLDDDIGTPKKTKSVLFAHDTPPSMITGVRANAELSVRAAIKFLQFSVRPEKEALAIDAYLKSLKPVPSPYLVNGKLSRRAMRGKRIFEGKAGCWACHKGKYFTDMEKHDVGTGTEISKGKEFDTPTLREIWRTGPYLYDGRAATMKAVFREYNKSDKHGKTSKLTEEECSDLVEYVLSL